MPSVEDVLNELNDVIGCLVEVGLAGDQNAAILLGGPERSLEITFPQAKHISVALKDWAYAKIYEHLVRERAYSAKLVDGALIQMMYGFDKIRLCSHRLAFFPAPDLEEFQNNPDIYLEDSLYAEVVAKSIVPFPLRFDYQFSDSGQRKSDHPNSHLTLGQYENCRIPVTSPLTPARFVGFIVRNFYHTGFCLHADRLPSSSHSFDDCISTEDRRLVHMQIPPVR
jgi:hypothetical protein